MKPPKPEHPQRYRPPSDRIFSRAVQTNWRNAAGRLARVIEKAGERGVW